MLRAKAEVKLDHSWGLDHGCWSVMRHLYPDADVPIVQMSLYYESSPQEHYNLARQLSPLRKEGVLIVGSGNMVHNFGLFAWDNPIIGYGYDWALEANEKMKNFILNDEPEKLINYTLQRKSYNLAIPTSEHYLSLLYALVLKEKDEGKSV